LRVARHKLLVGLPESFTSISPVYFKIEDWKSSHAFSISWTILDAGCLWRPGHSNRYESKSMPTWCLLTLSQTLPQIRPASKPLSPNNQTC
jgi:hypothetical protein